MAKEAKRGGKRSGAGRKRVTPEIPLPRADRGIASRVLASVNEEALWTQFLHVDDKGQLRQLTTLTALERGERKWAAEFLTNKRDGKPAQGVFVGDTRESARELDFGDLPDFGIVPAPTGQSGTVRRPQ